MNRLCMVMVCLLLVGCDFHINRVEGDGAFGNVGQSFPDVQRGDPFTGVRWEETIANDVSGSFFLAMKLIIAPHLPLQFVASSTFTSNQDGTGTLRLVLHPLSLDITSTSSPREFVGDPVDLGEFPVDENGAFEVDLGEVNMPGEANPISGSPITATLTLKGTIQGEDLVCGLVQGMITAPITASLDYNNSSFAAVRIQVGEFYPVYEEDMLLECPSNLDAKLLAPEKSLKSCPGYIKNESWPESYQTFCQEFLTSELLETGNTCFYVPDTGHVGCFCKICALQEAEINWQEAEINCVKELCKF